MSRSPEGSSDGDGSDGEIAEARVRRLKKKFYPPSTSVDGNDGGCVGGDDDGD